MPTGKLVSTRSPQTSAAQSRQHKKIILTPHNVTPSHDMLYCLGVLNPTIIAYKGRRCLLFRSDEYAINEDEYKRGDLRILPVPTLSDDFTSVIISNVYIP